MGKIKLQVVKKLVPGPHVQQDKVFFPDVQAQLSAHHERGTSGVERAVPEEELTELRSGDSQPDYCR